jgi:ribokinase
MRWTKTKQRTTKFFAAGKVLDANEPNLMKKYDVVVVGGANTDYVVKGRRLPLPGETVDGDFFLEAHGGKGANQAVACVRLGARVAFIGRLGRDRRGDEAIRNLRREGVHVSQVGREPGTPTGVALIMVDADGEKQILVLPGANHRLTITDIKRAAPLLRSTKILLIQYEVPIPALLLAAQIARKAGARIVLDPAPARPSPKQLLRLVDIVRPNASETEALTGLKVRNAATARRAAKKLFAAGIRAVALQLGDRGDLIIWREGEQWLPRLKVRTVDATGAGDAFAAGLAVALAEGRPYREAGLFANTAAALATTKLGAQPALPRRHEVIRLCEGPAMLLPSEGLANGRVQV